MKKKLVEYPKSPVSMSLGANVDPLVNWEIRIPAADAEHHDRENAAKDAVVEAAGEPVKRLIKLGGCTGEICNECIDGCQHYPYCLALAALKQVRDE